MTKTKMLRVARNSALLFAAVSGVAYLTGCSSEDGIEPNPEVPEATVDTDSYSVYGANQSRIHNYGSSSTRAGEFVDAVDSFTMPECPAVPAGTFDMSTLTDGWMVDRDHKGENLWLPAGKTFGQFVMSATYYVQGTLDFSYGFQGVAPGSVVYVMPGGTFKMGGTLDPNLTVYNYGTVEIANGLTISGKLYSSTDIDAAGEVGVDGEFFSKGSITADNVRLNGNAIACAFIADNKITFNGQGTFKTSYFKAHEAELNTGYVVLDNNGLMVTDVLFVTNEFTRFSVNGTNAVVAANTFYTNNVTWPKATFAPEIALDFKECKIGNQYYANDANFNDFEFTVSYEGRTIYVPSAGCHGSYGEKPAEPSTPDEPIVEIKKVTDIDPIEAPDHGDHDHGVLSATCINFDGNTAYASYHLRGAGQKGCIEVFNDNGNGGIALGSYMIAPDYDFNHLIVDNGNIITVGNHAKKAAFIGSLPVSFASSENATRDDFKVKSLTTDDVAYGPSEKDPNTQIKTGYQNAGDGNCVVRQGDYYYVATYRGYGAINTDFSKVLGSFKKTNGSCKHISINGGTAAVLALDTYSETSSTASAWTFDANDYNFSNALSTYAQIGTVAPVDGKNVVAVDGNDIYACLSTGGLVRLSDGKTFKRGNNVPVNGMAFDDKYVYVANGSFVSVLDKADLHEVCYYHASNEKSANYIALKNGKIYVAFGENGIQVYQLVEKEIAE